MTVMKRDRALAAFGKLSLSPMNEKLARYWFSLWSGDVPPMRAQLSPSRMKDLLPGIGIFEVRPGESSRCRLSGTAIQRALGREIAGLEWRQYTPADQWHARLARNSQIAEGGVGVGLRRARADQGGGITQELQLPFADRTEDGARLILFHLDWRPEDTLNDVREIAPIRVADEFRVLSLAN
jgi:hypothetical protein